MSWRQAGTRATSTGWTSFSAISVPAMSPDGDARSNRLDFRSRSKSDDDATTVRVIVQCVWLSKSRAKLGSE